MTGERTLDCTVEPGPRPTPPPSASPSAALRRRRARSTSSTTRPGAGWRFRIVRRGRGRALRGPGGPGHQRRRGPAHRCPAGRAQPRGRLHPPDREGAAMSHRRRPRPRRPSRPMDHAPPLGPVADRPGHPAPRPLRHRPGVPRLPGPGDPPAAVPALRLRQGPHRAGLRPARLPAGPVPRPGGPGRRAHRAAEHGPPLVIEFSYSNEIEDRLLAPLPDRGGGRGEGGLRRHAGLRGRRGHVPGRRLDPRLDPLAGLDRRRPWW